MIQFAPRWDTEVRSWLKSKNQAYADQFGETAILTAIADAGPAFKGYEWCKNSIDIAMDPLHPQVVWIEQGAHQLPRAGLAPAPQEPGTSVRTVTSAGAPTRIGGPHEPVPRLT